MPAAIASLLNKTFVPTRSSSSSSIAAYSASTGEFQVKNKKQRTNNPNRSLKCFPSCFFFIIIFFSSSFVASTRYFCMPLLQKWSHAQTRASPTPIFECENVMQRERERESLKCSHVKTIPFTPFISQFSRRWAGSMCVPHFIRKSHSILLFLHGFLFRRN